MTEQNTNNNHYIETIFNMIMRRNDFYRSSARFMISVFLIGSVSLVILFITATKMLIGLKSNWYVQANLDGTVIVEENLQSAFSDQTELTDDYVINWAYNAVPNVYDLNFLDSNVSFRNMVKYFTPPGYKAYVYQLQTGAKILDTINIKKLAVQGYSCGEQTIEVLEKGVQSVENYPVYVWRLKMPIVAVQKSSEESSAMVGNLVIGIQRVPRIVSKDAIAIYSFIITDPKSYKIDATPGQLCQQYVLNKTN